MSDTVKCAWCGGHLAYPQPSEKNFEANAMQSAEINHWVEQAELLKTELGKATSDYYMKVQGYGVKVAQLEHRNGALKALLKRAYQMPRPWIDGGITWDDWDALMTAIEEAIA